MERIRVATWNVGWTSSRSGHFEQSRDLITELSSDILVLTETTRSLVPDGGFLARGGPDAPLRGGAEGCGDRAGLPAGPVDAAGLGRVLGEGSVRGDETPAS